MAHDEVSARGKTCSGIPHKVSSEGTLPRIFICRHCDRIFYGERPSPHLRPDEIDRVWKQNFLHVEDRRLGDHR